jgi:hypothetical protein
MEILIKIEKNIEDVKRVLKGDDIVGRSSIIFREASSLGMKEKCYYCLISGTEDQCEQAKKLVEGKAELIEDEEKQKIIQKIRSEEEKAAEGFGAIFKL